jgi:hypothetical protein
MRWRRGLVQVPKSEIDERRKQKERSLGLPGDLCVREPAARDRTDKSVEASIVGQVPVVECEHLLIEVAEQWNGSALT